MSVISRDGAWRVLPVYVFAGLLAGLADPWLGRWIHGMLGVKPGVATALSVNLVFPLVAVGLAVARPRMGTAWLGALLLMAGFLFGLAVAYPAGHGWRPDVLLRSVHPVQVVAGLGYGLLGTLSVLRARGPGALGIDGPGS